MRVPVFSDAILPNFIKQRFVADLKKCGSLLAIPVGFIKSLCNGFGFGAVFGAAGEGFESPGGLGSITRNSRLEFRARTVSARLQFIDGELFIAEHQISLNKISQLPKIPRPRIIRAGLQ